MRPLLSSQNFSATLYRLADWLKPEDENLRKIPASPSKAAHSTVFPLARKGNVGAAQFAGHVRTPRPTQSRRPLRVVRVVDADQPRSNLGRIVISGCMADVCDELDRLIQKEGSRTQ
jgi:hypothetical protein